MKVVIACLLSAIASVVALLALDDPLIAVVAFVAVFGANLAAWFATARGLFSALSLFLIAPGLFGEMSSVITAGGVVALFVLILSYRPEASSRTGLEILAVASMAAIAVGMVIVGQPALAGIVLALALAAVLASRRRTFLIGMSRGLLIIYAVFAFSYLITMLIGFAGSQITILDFGRRSMELYFPFTPATAGPPLIPGTRRGAPLIGEPGLVIFYLLPLAALVFTTRTTKQKVWLTVLIVGVLFAVQSLASLLVGIAVVILGVALQRLRRRSIGTAILVAVAVAIAAPGLITSAFDAKSSAASVSFTDRGFGSDVGNANINLLVALENTPLLGAMIIAALVCALCVASRSIPGIVMWVGFASTALAAQPSHWQFGAWFLLTAYLLNFASQPEDRVAIFDGVGARLRSSKVSRTPDAARPGVAGTATV